MKAKQIFLAVIAAMAVGVGTGSGATNEVSGLLQKGLFEEEANHNLEAAIQAYQGVVVQTDKDHQFAATAIFRLGECYRKQGKTNEANAQYQRILREFADQTELAVLSRQQLGNAAAPAPDGDAGDEAKSRLQRRRGEETEADRIAEIQAIIKDSPDRINARDDQGRTPLWRSVMNNQLVVAKFILENRGDTEIRDYFARTPLVEAVEKGDKKMAELLLQHGADVNAAVAKDKVGPHSMINEGDDGNTPLHYAALYGYKGIAEVLLAHGATADAKNADGNTPLHLATQKGFKSVAEVLLAHGANIEAQRNTGATALHEAAYAGNTAIAELLLAHKAKVNAVDGNGATALYMAADTGYPAVTETLIAHGADLNLQNTHGMTALMEAIAQKRWDVAKILIRNGAEVKIQQPNNGGSGGWTALHFAVDKNNPELIKLLLEKGAELDAVARTWAPGELKKNNGDVLHDFTPLMMAVLGKQQDIVQLLLDRGANINFKNADGETPLLVAVNRTSPEMVKFLLNHEADVKVLDRNGWSLLHHAANNSFKDITELLLAHGINPNLQLPARSGQNINLVGWSALHFAIAHRQTALVELLLEHGADVNVQTANGETPLLGAIRYNNNPAEAKTMVELLLAHGANVNLANVQSQAALDLIGANNTNEIGSLLRQHGAVSVLERGTIRITRNGQTAPGIVFWRDANGYNRHTLFEVLGYTYPHQLGLAYQPLNGTGQIFSEPLPELPGFYFPDFAHIKIHHVENLSGAGEKTNVVTLDLEAAFNAGDCSADMKLNWGDVVELPELDHNVSENWQGLSQPARETLKKCLERHVSVSVKGNVFRVTLTPKLALVSPSSTHGDKPSGDGSQPAVASETSAKTELPVFWLSDVVRGARVILASSDVTRIKVRRLHKPEMDFNLDKIDMHSDLWLEDGDHIEIPEKPWK